MALSRGLSSGPSSPTSGPDYCGRFAPSPTGPLHLGSLVAALASWLDARAHAGRWLVRIEDIDPPREDAGAARAQLAALVALGLAPDEPPTYQSDNSGRYLQALATLQAAGQLYPCICSRSAVELAAQRLGLPPTVYPGTCRDLGPAAGAAARRVRVPPTGGVSWIAPAGSSRSSSSARWVTSWCGVPTACGPISSQWSSMTPPSR